LRIVAGKKNRATLDWQNFEDHLKDARLEIFRFLDSVDGRADSQKGGEIARQPNVRRKRVGNLVGLKKNGILTVQLHRDGGDELSIEGIGERNACHAFIVLDEKNELRRTDFDPIAMFERFIPRRNAVHEGSVEAFEVCNLDLSFMI